MRARASTAMWRNVAAAVMALGVLAGLARRPCHEARAARGVKRRVAPLQDAIRARLPRDGAAMAASLWMGGALGPCLVAARWTQSAGAEGPVSAHFAAVMCMDSPMTMQRASYRPLPRSQAHAAVRRVVRIESGGATIVRLVSLATVRPKRALFGVTPLRAAA